LKKFTAGGRYQITHIVIKPYENHYSEITVDQ